MNKEYQTQGNDLIVKNEYGKKTKRPLTNNFKEILITENNIEEIEELIKKEESTQDNYKKRLKSNSMFPFISSSMWLLTSILYFCSAKIGFACLYLFISSFWGIRVYDEFRTYSKLTKASKKWISILEEQLESEKNNLKELQNDNENNLNFNNEISGDVPYSEKIENLEMKLQMFNYYIDNKKDCIKAYKKGCLKEMRPLLFDDKSLLLLEELIKNDLEEDIQDNKEKQKVLTNKKNIRKF